MQKAIINLNGRILSGANLLEARVSVWDRSYLYGDSLYEVARTYGGRLLALDEHLKRLQQSAILCKIDLAQSNTWPLLCDLLRSVRVLLGVPAVKRPPLSAM